MSRQTHLNMDQAESFNRAMDAFDHVKGTPAAKDFFISIDQELKGKEILVATHKSASRFLDKYILECPVESLHSLLNIFSNKIEYLCFDASGSHCLEGVIQQSIQFADNKDFKPTFAELFKNLITNLCNDTVGVGNLAEDRYGSHVLRSIITSLSENKSLSGIVEKKLIRPVIQVLIKSPDKARVPQFSAVLQTIAKLNPENNQKVLTYLANSIPTEFDAVCDRSTSKLIEEVIKLGIEAPIQKIYETIFKDNALKAARHSVANFVLQRWLEQCTKPMFTGVAKELIPNIGMLINDQPEVVVAVCNAAARLAAEQENIIAEFNKFKGSDNLINALLGTRKEKCGAQVLQAICRFQQKPADAIVGAFLDLPKDRLQSICVSKTGTYVVTEYLRSDLKKSAKRKLVDRLIPILPEIAGDRAGSYIVEDAFKASDMEKKVAICDELTAHPDLKTNAPNIWRSLKLDSFKSRFGQWEHEMITIASVENAMKDIIEDKPAKPSSVPEKERKKGKKLPQPKEEEEAQPKVEEAQPVVEEAQTKVEEEQPKVEEEQPKQQEEKPQAEEEQPKEERRHRHRRHRSHEGEEQ